MYESKYGTNKPSRVSVSQMYVLYSCNYDNKMILTLTLTLTKSEFLSSLNSVSRFYRKYCPTWNATAVLCIDCLFGLLQWTDCQGSNYPFRCYPDQSLWRSRSQGGTAITCIVITYLFRTGLNSSRPPEDQQKG